MIETTPPDRTRDILPITVGTRRWVIYGHLWDRLKLLLVVEVCNSSQETFSF